MTPSKVVLFMHPGTCALVPHILLEYTGVQFDAQPVHSTSMNSDFAEVNAKKQVPVLLLDDNVITENPAIIQAINHLAPDKKILGTDTIQFLRACEWMNWLSGPLQAAVWGPFVRPWRWTDDPAAEAGIREKCKSRLVAERFDMIESKLPESGWALGDNLTAVDIYLYPFFGWAKSRAGLDMESNFPKWAKLVEKVGQLEAVKAVEAKENQIAEELKGKSDWSSLR